MPGDVAEASREGQDRRVPGDADAAGAFHRPRPCCNLAAGEGRVDRRVHAVAWSSGSCRCLPCLGSVGLDRREQEVDGTLLRLLGTGPLRTSVGFVPLHACLFDLSLLPTGRCKSRPMPGTARSICRWLGGLVHEAASARQAAWCASRSSALLCRAPFAALRCFLPPAGSGSRLVLRAARGSQGAPLLG